MKEIRLGKTEMMVSELGFGSIPIQRLESDEEAVSVITRCLDLGITFIDTAASYTGSEKRIGRTIADRRDGLIIATKSKKRTPEEVESELEQSLERLGTDYIDLYQFHNVTNADTLNTILAKKGPLAVVEKAKSKGLIKHIGVTSHSMDIAKQLIKSGYFETIMVPLNFIAYESADEIIPLAREYDLGFIAMKPLGGGRLDNPSLAFKYLFQFPDIVPLVGIQKVDEIEEITRIYGEPRELTTTEWNEIEQLRQTLGQKFCHRCEYCQPCQMGIPISVMLSIASFAKRMPPEHIFRGPLSSKLELAAECLKCGECEERCPYHLPIREMLEEQYDWYQKAKADYQRGLLTR